MTINKATALSLRSISESVRTSLGKIEAESELYRTYLQTIKKQLSEDFTNHLDLESFVPELSAELKIIDILGEVIAKLNNAYSIENVTEDDLFVEETNEAAELLPITLKCLRGNTFDDYKVYLKESVESDEIRFKAKTINTNIEHIIDSYESLQSLAKILVELDKLMRSVIEVA